MSDSGDSGIPHISPRPNGLAGLILDGAGRRKRERTTLCGQEVECIEMTVAQRVDIMQRCFTRPQAGMPSTPIYSQFYPALLINGLVEPGTDTPVFTLAHAEAINGLPGGEVQNCVDRVMRLSGLSEKAEKEIAGNSGAAVLAA
jgi:hypothetical protein